jgi:hypothetical protein
MEKYKDQNWLYNEYVVNKRSIADIARCCNKSLGTIIYYLNKLGIEKRTRSETLFILRKNPPIEMKEELKEFIIGNVLGDGGIHSNNIRTASYAHSSKYYDMLVFISNYLSSFGIEQMGNIREYKHPQNNATYFCYWSKNYEELFDMRTRLYSERKKIVPKDISLTPAICLHWYIGDGSLSKRNIGNPYIRLCTQGFSVEDVILLKDKLCELGIKTTRTESGNSLRISSSSTKNFLNYVGECPEEIKNIYGYKFNL